QNETGQKVIFTDPLGQYPVFYFISNKSFLISNNFWLLCKLSPEKSFNEECMADYVTYQSSLNQETIRRDVRRLTMSEFVRLDTGSGAEYPSIEQFRPLALNDSY